MVTRRTVVRRLVVTGSMVGVAGCTAGGGTTTTNGTSSQSTSGSTTTTQSTSGSTTTSQSTSGSTTAGGTASGGSPTVDVRSVGSYGDVLVGPNGKSLYLLTADTRGADASTCSGSCAHAWPPLTASGTPTKGDGVSASLSTFDRGDGTTQVTANGWPLYSFSGDSGPGDANGQGVASFGGKWYLLKPDGTPVRTPGTSSSSSSGGY